jgi:hypothetical protein
MRQIFLAATAAVSLLATPALAQSFTPEIGSGNIAGTQLVGNQTYPSPAQHPIHARRATDAFAQSPNFRSNYHWPLYNSQGRDLNEGW